MFSVNIHAFNEKYLIRVVRRAHKHLVEHRAKHGGSEELSHVESCLNTIDDFLERVQEGEESKDVQE